MKKTKDNPLGISSNIANLNNDLTELKALHRQYHQLAGEYVAYVSMSSIDEASQIKKKLEGLTEKLIKSIKEISV
ncbi:MAG: hypothetical protein HQL46_10780 [Gammaproteobacteria bacterium]|nr:hypothetical protein [Gammaproteobacteria bacterium]